jgi:hypothetical protein
VRRVTASSRLRAFPAAGGPPLCTIPNFGQTSVGRGAIFIPQPTRRDDEKDRREHYRNIVALSRPEGPSAPVGVWGQRRREASKRKAG